MVESSIFFSHDDMEPVWIKMKEIDWQGNERWVEPQIKDHNTWLLEKIKTKFKKKKGKKNYVTQVRVHIKDPTNMREFT